MGCSGIIWNTETCTQLMPSKTLTRIADVQTVYEWMNECWMNVLSYLILLKVEWSGRDLTILKTSGLWRPEALLWDALMSLSAMSYHVVFLKAQFWGLCIDSLYTSSNQRYLQIQTLILIAVRMINSQLQLIPRNLHLGVSKLFAVTVKAITSPTGMGTMTMYYIPRDNIN